MNEKIKEYEAKIKKLEEKLKQLRIKPVQLGSCFGEQDNRLILSTNGLLDQLKSYETRLGDYIALEWNDGWFIGSPKAENSDVYKNLHEVGNFRRL